MTGVSEANGALHVDLSIRNDTGDWSAMNVAASTAQVTDGSGKTSSCATAFVGTSVFVNDSGWFLPPGFVMKGYTAGSPASPVTQLNYVECAGVAKAAGEKLADQLLVHHRRVQLLHFVSEVQRNTDSEPGYGGQRPQVSAGRERPWLRTGEGWRQDPGDQRDGPFS